MQKENLPGGGTLHSMMTPHGPDNKTFVQTSQQELKPVKMEGTMVRSVISDDTHYASTIVIHVS